MSSLQPEIAQEVRDFLINPPSDEPYDKLKSELIKRSSESQQKRLHQLLISEELGDKKPSQLLRRMKQLLGHSTRKDDISRQLFLQRLPRNVHQIFASSSDTVDLEQLALIADKIVEVASPPTVATFSKVSESPSSQSALESRIDELQAQVSQLTILVQTLATTSHASGRSRERSRSKVRKS